MASPGLAGAMRLALLGILALAGCTTPGATSIVLLVAEDLLAIHGSEGAGSARTNLEPHCSHIVLRATDAGTEATLRFDLADPVPAGVLVREYATDGSTTAANGEGSGTGHVALLASPARVESPLHEGPLLTTVLLEGSNVRFQEAVLRPGQATSLSFSYQVDQAGKTFDVEETLVVRHLGVVAAAVERGGQCR